jgi:hypothetical protein
MNTIRMRRLPSGEADRSGPSAESRRGRSRKPKPAPHTEGLTPLDQDRAASVADEGGASGAAVESQDGETSSPRWAERTEERKVGCDPDDRVSHGR